MGELIPHCGTEKLNFCPKLDPKSLGLNFTINFAKLVSGKGLILNRILPFSKLNFYLRKTQEFSVGGLLKTPLNFC